MRYFALLIAFALPAHAHDAGQFTVLERREIGLEAAPTAPAQVLRLSLAYFKDGGWSPDSIIAAVRRSAQILRQCGIVLTQAELVLLDAPERYRYYLTPLSRELARAVPLRKPAVYFVIDSRQQPAFDAEAIGRGNSRSRPELADTVWVTRGTRDPGIALAHEIAHVLMDSGEHSDEPGNLMRDETSPESTLFSPAQCARLRKTGTANALLDPPR